MKKIFSKYTAVILAGGNSFRMGEDKALLKLNNGKTFIQSIYDIISLRFDKIIISTNNPKIRISGAKHVADIIKNSGPAGGICSALRASETERCFVTTVDMPFINHDLIDFLVYSDSEKFDAVFISEGNKPYPLTGIYSKKTYAVFEKEIKKGNRKITNILYGLKFKNIDISDQSFYSKHILQNINTREDYKKIFRS